MGQKRVGSGRQDNAKRKCPTGTHVCLGTKKRNGEVFARLSGVTEILELILLHLDVKSLLPCLRVSVHFRATIEGSIRLQRVLFLTPEKIDVFWTVNCVERTVKKSKSWLNFLVIGQDHIRTCVPMKANPVILSHLELTLQHNSLYGQLFDRHETDKKYTGLILLRGILNHTETAMAASCRDMLLTQPPCYAVAICYRGGLRPWRVHVIRKTHPLTFGELTDEWREYSRGWPLSIQLQAQRSMRILPERGVFPSDAEKEAIESVNVCRAPKFRDWRDHRTLEWHGESIIPDQIQHR